MMRLSDVMSASGLSGYAVVALLLFIFAFALVLVTIFAPSRRAHHDRNARLPFDDGGDVPPEQRGIQT